jgi:hypothetical protein
MPQLWIILRQCAYIQIKHLGTQSCGKIEKYHEDEYSWFKLSDISGSSDSKLLCSLRI